MSDRAPVRPSDEELRASLAHRVDRAMRGADAPSRDRSLLADSIRQRVTRTPQSPAWRLRWERPGRLGAAAAVALSVIVIAAAAALPHLAPVGGPRVVPSFAGGTTRGAPETRPGVDPGDVQVLTGGDLERLLYTGDPFPVGRVVVAAVGIDSAAVDLPCRPAEPCPVGVLTGTSRVIDVVAQPDARVAPADGPVALSLVDPTTVEYLGPVVASDGDLVWDWDRLRGRTRGGTGDPPLPGNVVIADGWLVGVGDANPGCPASPPDEPTMRPDLPFHACPPGPWLTEMPEQPVSMTPDTVTITHPTGGLQVQRDAYARFAPGASRDEAGLDVPRYGRYLLRVVAGSGRGWQMLGRLDPIVVPPDAPTPMTPAGSLEPSLAPAAADRPLTGTTLPVPLDSDLPPGRTAQVVSNAYRHLVLSDLGRQVEQHLLVPARLSAEGETGTLWWHDYTTGEQILVTLDLSRPATPIVATEYPTSNTTGLSAWETQRVHAAAVADARVTRVLGSEIAVADATVVRCPVDPGFCASAVIRPRPPAGGGHASAPPPRVVVVDLASLQVVESQE